MGNMLGEWIKQAREKAGLSQSVLAEKLFVTQQAISDWERGRKYPQIDKIYSICEACNCALTEILCDQNKACWTLKIDYTDALKKAADVFNTTENDVFLKNAVQNIVDKKLENTPLIANISLTERQLPTT